MAAQIKLIVDSPKICSNFLLEVKKDENNFLN